MAQYEITGEAPPPLPGKRPALGVYDIFETADGGRLFVGVVTDTQWEIFCREFGEPELAADTRLRSNGDRVKERQWLIPRLGDILRRHAQGELAAKLEAIGLPFAPIAKPWDLLEDPHLIASGGLLETRLPQGKTIRAPALPLTLDGAHLPKRRDPPAVGEHTREVLGALGFAASEIERLAAQRVVAAPA
jgi:crotonobetainyl-CoA:carnitine CoA-transferase CaiB-like acyl-CoA transferase